MTGKYTRLLAAALEGKMPPEQIKAFRIRYESPIGCLLNILIFVICVVAGIGLLGFLRHRIHVVSFELQASIVLVLACLSACIPVYWLGRRVGKRMMVQLRREGIRPLFCLNCEYDLKGSTSLQCPECGTGLAPVMEGPPIADQMDGRP